MFMSLPRPLCWTVGGCMYVLCNSSFVGQKTGASRGCSTALSLGLGLIDHHEEQKFALDHRMGFVQID